MSKKIKIKIKKLLLGGKKELEEISTAVGLPIAPAQAKKVTENK